MNTSEASGIPPNPFGPNDCKCGANKAIAKNTKTLSMNSRNSFAIKRKRGAIINADG